MKKKNSDKKNKHTDGIPAKMFMLGRIVVDITPIRNIDSNKNKTSLI
jgi:hypothetical protein